MPIWLVVIVSSFSISKQRWFIVLLLLLLLSVVSTSLVAAQQNVIIIVIINIVKRVKMSELLRSVQILLSIGAACD